MQLFTLILMLSLPQLAQAQNLDAEEQDMFVRINKLRDLSGLRPLRLDPALEEAARLHSEHMDLIQDLSHEEEGERLEPSQRIELAGGHFATTGENIACGNEASIDTFNQWLHSSGHLNNMTLEDYDSIGIARVGIHSANSQNCAYYWTTTFGGGHAYPKPLATPVRPLATPSANSTPAPSVPTSGIQTPPTQISSPDLEVEDDQNDNETSDLPSWEDLKNKILPYLRNW